MLCSAPGPALAQIEVSPTAGAPGVHAIVGARLVVAPGEVIEEGTLLVRDGVIVAVGTEVDVPPDARVWEGEGLTLYPGLIESYSPRSRPTDGGDEQEGDRPAGGHPNPLVQPQWQMAPYADDEDQAQRLRQAGFTTALAVPQPGVLAGAAALVNLGDGDLRGNLLAHGAAHGASLRAGARGYPDSTMGAVALFRQTILDARWYRDAQAAYASNPAQGRPPHDLSAAALDGVVAGDVPLVMESADELETLRIARHTGELELTALVVGSGREYRRLEEVAATGLTFLLPVDFPDAPKVEGDEDLAVELDELRHWQRAPENPRLLLDAGTAVAFTSHRLTEPSQLHGKLAAAIARGLDPDAALAALTTTPARLLGIDDRAGTLAAGKMANLIEAEGELFSDEPGLIAVWVDGRRYRLGDPAEAPTVDPAGTWEVQVDGDDGPLPVTLDLTGTVDALEGTARLMGQTLELSSARVSGATLTVTVDLTPLGVPGAGIIELTISGDTASGTATSPQGATTATARRTAKPDPQEHDSQEHNSQEEGR